MQHKASMKWYRNPLAYAAMVGLIALAYVGAVRALPQKDVNINNRPNSPQVTTLAPTQAYPTVTQKPSATVNRYLESPDKLASVECFSASGCTPEELQAYLDKVYPLAAGGKRVSAVISDRYKSVGGQKVKQDGKNLLLVSENDYEPGDGGLVRIESEQLDSTALSNIEGKVGNAYKFLVDTFKPSKKPNVYVTVSPDGTRANTTFFLGENPPQVVRESATAFYPWHITDDFSQMTYELGTVFDKSLEYTSEAFLTEFCGVVANWSNMPRDKVKQYGINSYLNTNSQVGLGEDVYVALALEGFDAPRIAQLAQKLEGKRAKWEQFKTEADAVAGKHLTKLDELDYSVGVWRSSQK